MKFIILDGYTDEPTCLGVPPYISTYPRYIAGAIRSLYDWENITYLTIDQLRSKPSYRKTLSSADYLIIIAGVSVPGRYLSGYPMSHNEIISYVQPLHNTIKILCGPAARYGFGLFGGKKPRNNLYFERYFDAVVSGDCELFLHELLSENMNINDINTNIVRSHAAQIKDFSVKGAAIVTQHPNFPERLITEIETYRGCTRGIHGGCSFCSEPFKGIVDFRDQKDILSEIQALYEYGIKHIRLGNQPCIFSYKAHQATQQPFPRPNPQELHRLFSKLRVKAPNLETIHIDNANPGIIAKYPDEARKIAEIIIKYHTPGDVAAFGVESVDPIVIKENNLKATSEEVLSAIEILNEMGRERGENGMPELLPGLNFLFGLKGETKKTYQLNYDFLKQIIEKNLWIRRINIRKVIPLPNTPLDTLGNKIIRKHTRTFSQFKTNVKEHIERPLLKKMMPIGTILSNVITEKQDGNTMFSRQMGSYPLLIGVKGIFQSSITLRVIITDHGYRSLTALPYPLPINTASRTMLEALPGIGSKRAARILTSRPFANEKEFLIAIDDESIGKKIIPFLCFNTKTTTE